MAKASNMSAPVTRGELKEELKLLRSELVTKAELRHAMKLLRSELATKAELQHAMKLLRSELATKAELRHAILAAKAELQQAVLAAKAELQQAVLAAKADRDIWGGALLAHIGQQHKQLQIDLARHANALHESMVALINGHDDKYKDLPPRVGRLESAVFAPKPP